MNRSTVMMIDEINKRLVIRKYDRNAISKLIKQSQAVCLKHQLEKIWLWAFPEDTAVFLDSGYRLEGTLETSSFDKPSVSLAFYLTPSRKITPKKDEEDALLQQIMSSPLKSLPQLTTDYSIRLLHEEDCIAISALLSKVFATYPTPMDNPEYVKKLMREDCLFAGVFFFDRLVSLSSAYPEKDWNRCELTDCATLAEFRGLALTERLIGFLEQTLKDAPYTLYSLARSRSFGINRVFHKQGYQYRGRLLNNCDIYGGFEDMNLWVKSKSTALSQV